MTIEEIKTAINDVIRSHEGVVYSNETQEGYKKPAFFVDIMPLEYTRISAAYDEVEIPVEIHFEPAIRTREECLRVAGQINNWFSVPIAVGDRQIKAPENIQFSIEDDFDAVLYADFTLITTVIHNEDQYKTSMPDMGGEIHITKINRR